jgi:XTP/dITP diphosphohydrolase
MKELVVATRNTGKLKEIRQLLEGNVEVIFSLADFPDLPEIVEDGDTFEENALKKACLTSRKLGKPVLADDSGLCVDALAGKPGIFSSRFAGEDADDEANNLKLLTELGRFRLTGVQLPFTVLLSYVSPMGHTIRLRAN